METKKFYLKTKSPSRMTFVQVMDLYVILEEEFPLAKLQTGKSIYEEREIKFKSQEELLIFKIKYGHVYGN